MASGFVTKVVGDGNSGTFSARFWCPDTSASPQLLFPAPMELGPDGNPLTSANPQPGYAPGGLQTIPATPFNRLANTSQYATGDLVADNATALSVVGLVFPNAVRAAGESIRVERLRLRKSGPSLLNAQFRVYLCRALPVLSVGDNGVFNTAGALAIDDIAHVVGWFDVTMDRSATAGARGVGLPNTGAAITLSPSSGTSLIGLIEMTAATGYIPVSGETFNATLEGQWS